MCLENKGFPVDGIPPNAATENPETGCNWFLIKIVFQIICGKGNHKPQFEEQLRLIAAADANAAIDKAVQLAKQEASVAEAVEWKFVAVTDIYPFINLLDGAEMFSKITEEEQEAAYVYTQQLKEKALRTRKFIIDHSTLSS
jgi:Domain of unknown function (DUF4288)